MLHNKVNVNNNVYHYSEIVGGWKTLWSQDIALCEVQWHTAAFHGSSYNGFMYQIPPRAATVCCSRTSGSTTVGYPLGADEKISPNQRPSLYGQLSEAEEALLDPNERKRLKYALAWVPLNLAEMLDDEKRQEPKYTVKSKREDSMQCKMGMCANEKLQADYERKLERLKSRSWLASYLDQKQPQASSWLKVMPAEKALSFTDNEWTATLRYFVAIPDGRLNLIPGQTCACGAAFTETHSENCKLRGWLTRRSDAVISVALEEARDCLWRTDQERAIPVNQQGNPSEGRMDGVCWPS